MIDAYDCVFSRVENNKKVPAAVSFIDFSKYATGMVAFPDSTTEPALLNVTDIKLNECVDRNDQITSKSNDTRIKDHAFTIHRDNMSNGKDNYALDYDCLEKGNDKNPSANIKAEPDVVKKVAGKRTSTYYKFRVN